jgi:hypothetical protein
VLCEEPRANQNSALRQRSVTPTRNQHPRFDERKGKTSGLEMKEDKHSVGRHR